MPAQGSTQGMNVSIIGLPASISGSVDPGDTLQTVTTTVTAAATARPECRQGAGGDQDERRR